MPSSASKAKGSLVKVGWLSFQSFRDKIQFDKLQLYCFENAPLRLSILCAGKTLFWLLVNKAWQVDSAQKYIQQLIDFARSKNICHNISCSRHAIKLNVVCWTSEGIRSLRYPLIPWNEHFLRSKTCVLRAYKNCSFKNMFCPMKRLWKVDNMVYGAH